MAEVGAAWVSVAPSMKGFGKKLKAGAESDTKKVGSGLGKTLGKAFAVVGGAAAAVGFLKSSIGEAREAQKVGALTTSTIKATGGAANVTRGQVEKLAGAISKKTGIDDETIQSGQNMLLTFKNIRNEAGKGNDIFNQTSQTLVDMAAAMGKDPKQAAIGLGKALNDPVKGMTALSRVGVTFTEGQKAQVKQMVATGDTMGAQKLILKELNSEFGGAAEAQATAGDKAKVAFGNLQETVGTALLPALDKLSNVFTNNVAPAITTFIGQLKSGEGLGGRVAAAFGKVRDAVAPIAAAIGKFIGQMTSGEGAGGRFAAVLGTIGSAVGKAFGFFSRHTTTVKAFGVVVAGLTVIVYAHNAAMAVAAAGGLGKWIAQTRIASAITKVWTAVQWAFNVAMNANPISLIIIVIAALVIGIVIAYKKSETFRKIVDGAFRGIAAAARFMWNNVVAPILRLMITTFGKVAGVWASVLKVLSKVPGFGWLKPVAKGLQNIADGANSAAKKIKDIPAHKKVDIDSNAEREKKKIDDLQRSITHLSGKSLDIVTHYINIGNKPKTPLPGRNAAGTDNWRGGPTWVGERGPEIVNLPRGARVTPNNEIGAGGGRQAITITNWKTGEGYMETIADSRVGAHARLSRETVRARR